MRSGSTHCYVLVEYVLRSFPSVRGWWYSDRFSLNVCVDSHHFSRVKSDLPMLNGYRIERVSPARSKAEESIIAVWLMVFASLEHMMQKWSVLLIALMKLPRMFQDGADATQWSDLLSWHCAWAYVFFVDILKSSLSCTERWAMMTLRDLIWTYMLSAIVCGYGSEPISSPSRLAQSRCCF